MASENTFPVVDAHHHIWRQQDLAWLQGAQVPRIFGEYSAIQRDYLIDEFVQDAAPHQVVKSVYVQANWPEAQALDEVRWVQSVSDAHGFPHATVGYANLADPFVGDLLDAQMKHAGFRGVRQQLHWHTQAQYCFAAAPDVFMQPQWQRGMAQVQERGLIFELQVFAHQMTDARRLVDAFPDVHFVLLHAGMLVDSQEATTKDWSAGLKLLSECPNVSTKLSALSTFARRCAPEVWQPAVDQALALFGPQRCMFGSNFPIEKIWTTYQQLIDTMFFCLRAYPLSVQRAVMHDNAVRVYRLA